MSRKSNNKNNSRSILQLIGFRAAENAIIIVYFYLLLQLLLQSVPSAAAQTNNDPSSTPNPYNFNTSTAIVILVLIFIFFFIGFCSIYLRQCTGTDRMDGSIRPTNGGTRRSRRTVQGLLPSLIESFPTFIYSDVKGLKIGKGALECAVCLNEFEDDETIRLLPKCDHVFHPQCIDAWLASHTTCPVCRANLVPDSVQTTAVTAVTQVPDPENGSHHENRPSEIDEAQNQVSIRVIDDPDRDIVQLQPDLLNPNQVPIQNRRTRSKARVARKFPRSHSTGHSIVQPGENCERFTLRLPEEVRRQLVSRKLNRSTSCVAFPSEDGSVSGGSSHQRNRSNGGEGSSRGRKNYQFWRLEQAAKSDRWMFNMAPPFFSSSSSVKSPRRGDGVFFTSVKRPFDCLSSKTDGGEPDHDQTSSHHPA